MGKLDEHIVTCLYVVLGILPQFVVAAARVAPALRIVYGLPPVGEEVAEVHTPATLRLGILVVVGHGGVTNGVYLLGCLQVAQHEECRNQKHQSD